MWKIVLIFAVMSLMSALVAARYMDVGPDTPVSIPCPSCSGERCTGVRLCLYGTFNNEMCGGQLDCYKAPGEVCGESVRRLLGRCRPGLRCRCGLCVGHLFNQSFDLPAPCRESRRARMRSTEHSSSVHD